jgi:hypothetical protein
MFFVVEHLFQNSDQQG